MDGLEFFPDGHRYRLDGQPVIGVTTALKVAAPDDYRFVPDDALAKASALGSAVHLLIELDCLGQLDVPDLDPDLVPYYRGWRRFLVESGFQVLLSESKVASRRYRFAGQLDLFGRLNAVPALIDAKRVAQVQRVTGPQTAAYEAALRETRPDLLPDGAPCQRYALQLRPGSNPDVADWRLHPFTDRGDFAVFASALKIAQWRLAA